MTRTDGPTLQRPLPIMLRVLGNLDCLVGGLRVVDHDPPCQFRLVGGKGEWIDADTGAWVDVHDITLDMAVQSHPHIGGILDQARVWQRHSTPLTYAAGSLGLLHDGTVGMLLPRTPWQPPAV